ncbi:hypothetical protein A2J03_24125 [Rhodococcus sp. EPR-157]|uniref:hypothetical protein n=1 Tax=Rhodococcus sp. EPR-157 TaxID=1813677 RepID=UPI0007BB5B7B|nr:hypothetical protein [Rhodococcus sp. EPR-157]KZF06687.1 hypothetical protein A2J03_24125 [Rhodococcus sp. EPR-157]
MTILGDSGAVPGDALTELARERRQKAEEESRRSKPAIIESVTQSEVVYSFDPAAVPYTQFDISALNAKLEELYSITLSEDLDFGPLLKRFQPKQLHELGQEELLRRLARASGSAFAWTDGQFPTRDDYVPIRSIRCNFESILVSVAGQSQVAEVVAQEVLEALWEAAGVKKKWSDLKRKVLLTGYGTRTRLNLGKSFEDTVNPEFLGYLRSNMVDGQNFAYFMGRQEGNSTHTGLMAAVMLDSLTFKIAGFNSLSGRAEDHELQFEVTRQSDYGTGRIVASSGLPYDHHEKLMIGLFGGPNRTV